MTSDSDFLDLDVENLQAQRSARHRMKRDSRILFIIYTIGLILFLALILVRQPPLYLTLPIIFVYYISFKLISNWRGWVALRTFKLYCPHCHQPLFEEKLNIFKNPSNTCPHCGKIALAPIKQLK
jgi:hypothetical protein